MRTTARASARLICNAAILLTLALGAAVQPAAADDPVVLNLSVAVTGPPARGAPKTMGALFAHRSLGGLLALSDDYSGDNRRTEPLADPGIAPQM